MPATRESASMRTGLVTAVPILLALGLAGAMGGLAALVLATVAGSLLGRLVNWIVVGNIATDTSRLDLETSQAAPVAASGPEDIVPSSTSPEREDLRLIKGFLLKVEAALVNVTRLTQIVARNEGWIDEVAARIGGAGSRIRGDDWVGQAKALVAARRAGA